MLAPTSEIVQLSRPTTGPYEVHGLAGVPPLSDGLLALTGVFMARMACLSQRHHDRKENNL